MKKIDNQSSDARSSLVLWLGLQIVFSIDILYLYLVSILQPKKILCPLYTPAMKPNWLPRFMSGDSKFISKSYCIFPISWMWVKAVLFYYVFAIVRQPHQNSDMLPNFKLTIFCIIIWKGWWLSFKVQKQLWCCCKNWQSYEVLCRRGKKVKTGENVICSAFEHTIIGGALF